MEGYLKKWTNVIYGWKKRYFMLNGSILHYYKKKGDKLKGKIHLAITILNIRGTHEIIIDTGVKKLELKAENMDDRNKWFNAFRVAKHEGLVKEKEVIKNDELNSNDASFNLNDNNNFKIYFSKKFDDLKKNIDTLTQTNNKLDNLIKLKSNSIKKDQINQIYIENKSELEYMNSNIESIINSFQKYTKELSSLRDSISDDPNNEVKTKKHSEDSIFTNKTNPLQENMETNEVVENEKIKSDKNFSFVSCQDIEDRMNNRRVNVNHQEIIKKQLNDIKIGDPINETDIFYDAQETINQSRLMLDNNIVLERKKTIDTIKDDLTIYDDPIFDNVRKSLPAIRKSIKSNFWSILKDSIGKELSKISVPVYFNEPLSMLQRLCENFQYADLLALAATDERSHMRLARVAAFCLGGFSYSKYRTLKFFNPLLGETYELINKDMKFRFFSEQVSHHPPISACYAEGNGYKFYTNSNAKSKFNLLSASLDIIAVGKVFVNFSNFNETISYSKPKAIVKNLIHGKMKLECGGSFIVNNDRNGDICEVQVLQEGKIDGLIKNVYGEVLAQIEGDIYSHMNIIMNDSQSEVLWKSYMNEDEANYYFTDFAINLNNLNEDMKNKLPPTDSRFRPDQRALEEQDYDLAIKEKERLEIKQRNFIKNIKSNNVSYKPMYFKESYDNDTGEVIYIYNRDYWKDRFDQNYAHFPDIFS